MSSPFVGEIRIFPFNFAPAHWAFCNGQLVAPSQNAALFNLLGTTYGGNGIQTFALPDLRGRTPVHHGSGPGLTPVQLGETAGTATVTLQPDQIPPHSHTPWATTDVARSAQPGNAYPAVSAGGGGLVYGAVDDITLMAASAVEPNQGSGLPHSNMQPYLVMNFCIALTGIFPQRS